MSRCRISCARIGHCIDGLAEQGDGYPMPRPSPGAVSAERNAIDVPRTRITRAVVGCTSVKQTPQCLDATGAPAVRLLVRKKRCRADMSWQHWRTHEFDGYLPVVEPIRALTQPYCQLPP